MKLIRITPLTSPVTKALTIPGSKSFTNRALILAAMTKTSVIINNPLFSDDTTALITCLSQLGIKIQQQAARIVVDGSFSDVKEGNYTLDANLSGTTIRFLLPILTVIPGTKILKGKHALNARPIKDLVCALTSIGAQITYLEKEGFPPLLIKQSQITKNTLTLSGSISSQYFSSLIMASPLFGGLTITVTGDQISRPYILMTFEIMKHFGVAVHNPTPFEYTVLKDQRYTAKEYTVEGDYSSAGYFFAIAALTHSRITVRNLNPVSQQADSRILTVLEKMGSHVSFGENAVTIQGNGVKPVSLSLIDFPDQAQTLAVLVSFAKGTSVLTGLRSLRVKETERVKALQTELAKMGIKTESTEDTLTIYGVNPKRAEISTYSDHRMAMAFAVAASTLPGMSIQDPDVVNKTFPAFWKTLASLGIKSKSIASDTRNIVLIGMRGSGKTTVSEILCKKLQREVMEIDAIITKRAGLKTAAIVEKYGWDYFRRLETAVVLEASGTQEKIISTGGGVVLNEQNVQNLRANGILILLDASLHTIIKRTGESSERPYLVPQKTREQEIKEVMIKRKTQYHDAADIIIPTDTLTPNEVADQIIKNLKQCR
jgi:3-phosphoshikimate 1-carboxyvinyltransferase